MQTLQELMKDRNKIGLDLYTLKELLRHYELLLIVCEREHPKQTVRDLREANSGYYIAIKQVIYNLKGQIDHK